MPPYPEQACQTVLPHNAEGFHTRANALVELMRTLDSLVNVSQTRRVHISMVTSLYAALDELCWHGDGAAREAGDGACEG